MMTRDMSESLEPVLNASLELLSVLEVRDHHHEVRLTMLIKFMCNMSIFESSWGSG